MAAADTITLAWDATSDAGAGYKLYVGTEPGSYSQSFDVGPATTFTFTDAVAGWRYCFAVSAYSASLESAKSNEVCSSSNVQPSLNNPGNQSSGVGQATSLELSGVDPDGQPLTYSATGLPPGITLQPSTGFISGAATTPGTYAVTISASDGVLVTSQSFTWTIGSSSTPPPTTPPPSGSVTLSALAIDRPSRDLVRLTWTAASWSGAWIVRNNTLLAETSNDGSYTDYLRPGSGTYTYAVCAPGATSGSSCSNVVTLEF